MKATLASVEGPFRPRLSSLTMYAMFPPILQISAMAITGVAHLMMDTMVDEWVVAMFIDVGPSFLTVTALAPDDFRLLVECKVLNIRHGKWNNDLSQGSAFAKCPASYSGHRIWDYNIKQ